VELYLYSPSRPLVACYRVTFTFTHIINCKDVEGNGHGLIRVGEIWVSLGGYCVEYFLSVSDAGYPDNCRSVRLDTEHYLSYV
jgi:hypothetical protein